MYSVSKYFTYLLCGFYPWLHEQEPQTSAITAAVKEAYQNMIGANFDISALFAQSKTQYYDSLPSALSAEVRVSQAQSLLEAYQQAVLMFLTKPVFTAEEAARARELANRMLTPLSTTSKSGKGSDAAEARKAQLIQALGAGVERLKAEVREKYKKLG